MINKVEWLKKHGPLHQFGRNIRVIVDQQTGNTTMKLNDKIHMKTKTKRNNK